MYACPKDWYMVLAGGTATCSRSASACDGLYLHREKRICTDDTGTCKDYLQGRVYEGQGEKLCMSAQECIRQRHYLYDRRKCIDATECDS